MISFTYQLSPESLSQGISASYAYRQPFRRIFRPLIAVILIAIGTNYFVTNSSEKFLFGILCFLIAIINLLNPLIQRRNTIKSVFAGKNQPLQISISATPETITFQSEHTSATSSWDGFIDYHIHKKGILLYPQRGIFYWIPDSASFQEGSWEEFKSIASSGISKKHPL